MKSLIAVFILVLVPSVHAVTVPNCIPGRGSNYSDLHKIAIMGEDNRRTLAEYAADRKRLVKNTSQFSAAGAFTCNGLWASAQLTGSSDTITTTGHAFFDFEKDCEKINRDVPCTFRPIGSSEEFEVDMTSRQGECRPFNRSFDWAVLKLKKKVPNAKFLKVPASDVVMRPGDKLTQIVESTENFQRGGSHPSSAQDCAVDFVVRDVAYGHTCDTGRGTSGSAHVREEGRDLVMIGLNTSYHGDEGDGGRPSRTNYNLAVPVAGDFLKAINRANGR